MTRTRIKICGLTREQDLDAAVSAGVDAVGFVLYAPSPRAVTAERAAAPAPLRVPVGCLPRRHGGRGEPWAHRPVSPGVFGAALQVGRGDGAVLLPLPVQSREAGAGRCA